MKKSLFYILRWLLLLVVGLSVTAELSAQNLEDNLMLLYEKLQCVDYDEKVGLGEVYVDNLSNVEAFTGGTFTLYWGDGSNSVWDKKTERMSHQYGDVGKYALVLEWMSDDKTQSVQIEDSLTVRRRPKALFADENIATCLNIESEIKIGTYQDADEKTVYTLSYGTGSGAEGTLIGEYSRQDLVEMGGIVKYKFEETLCDGYLTLRANNGCPDVAENIIRFSVVRKPKIVINFDEPKCTEQEFVTEVKDEDLDECLTGVRYRWVFYGHPKQQNYEGKEVEVLPFETPGTYNVALNITMGNRFACADTTVRATLEIIRHVTAGFDLGKNPICFDPEQEVMVKSNAAGDEVLNHYWEVRPGENVSGEGLPKDWVFKVSGEGEYEVTQSLANVCSEAEFKDTLVVKRNPEVKLEIEGTICSEEDGYKVLDFSNPNGDWSVNYDWHGNEAAAVWKIETTDGGTVEYVAKTSATSLYPAVKLKGGATYSFTVTVPPVEMDGVECGDPALRTVTRVVRIPDMHIKEEYDPMPQNEPFRLCFDETMTFENRSTGENLQHNWVIRRIGACGGVPEFTEGDAHSARITLKFDWGEYIVTDSMAVAGSCPVSKKVEYHILVGRNPEILAAELPEEVCTGEVVDMQYCMAYDFFNNVEKVKWTFSGGVEFVEGDMESPYPKVRFLNPGEIVHFRVEMPESEIQSCRYGEAKYVVEGDIRVRNNQLTSEVTASKGETDVCEGGSLFLVNKGEDKDESEPPLQYDWWALDENGELTDLCVFPEERTKQGVKVTFNRWGTYGLVGKIMGKCDEKKDTLWITVHKIPELTIKDDTLCPGVVEMKNHVSYEWFNSENQMAKWICVKSPDVGFDGTSEELFPVFDLAIPGDYEWEIRVPAHVVCKPEEEVVYRLKLHIISTEMQASFSVTDTVGCIDEGYELTLQQNSLGERLQYRWHLPSDEVFEWIEGDVASEIVKIRMTEIGDYPIRLEVSNGCSNSAGQSVTDDSVFIIKAFGVPRIGIESVQDKCEPFLFEGKEQVVIDIRNDRIRQVEWNITGVSAVGDAGYDYKNGTNEESEYPDISFQAGTYQVTVRYWNRCVNPGESSFDVSVDQLMLVQKLLDNEVCALSEKELPLACPDGGILKNGRWSLRDPMSADPDKVLKNVDGKDYFIANFEAYSARDIDLVYTYTNGSCVSSDTMRMHVWPLPFVEAGDSLEMCLNAEPLALVGKDSVAGSFWQENRGQWKQAGSILREAFFTPEKAGDFPLMYEYLHVYSNKATCINRDSTLMTVHPLPETGFTVQSTIPDSVNMGCIGKEVDFVPDDADGNMFRWSLGDGTLSGEEYTSGTYRHFYQQYGDMDVVCWARSEYGCLDTSEITKVEIVNTPPQADFDVSLLEGCPPFETEITIDREVYRPDHNYLQFHWDYGDGVETDTLGPITPKTYAEKAWDTTYHMRFTVSNVCGETHKDTTFTVRSVPKVSFDLMHQWECSPVWLEIQNTTTGNNCEWLWVFVNARTGDTIYRSDVRNPQYEFTTDSVSTAYYIILRAHNQCAPDDIDADTLVVKPRQVRAHFTPLDDAYACVNEEIIFQNNSTDTVSAIISTQWDFGDHSVSDEWSPVHRYEEAGIYSVHLKVNNGCGWDTITSPVTVFALPSLHIDTKGVGSLCEDDSLEIVLRSDQKLNHIEWNFGDGGILQEKDSLGYCFNGSGTFTVSVVGQGADLNHCTGRDSIDILVHAKPAMTILPLDTFVCSPYLYKPIVDGDAYLTWDYGDGSPETSLAEHLYVNRTDSVQRFKVSVQAENEHGCQSQYMRSVVIANQPVALFDKQVEKGNPQKVTFTILTEDATDCIWELPDRGVFHSLESQTVEIGKVGLYEGQLIIFNKYECSDTVLLQHDVLMKGLYFPNTFMPHSKDSKINRFNGIGIGLASYRLEVFDRYGNKVWETTELKDSRPIGGWDGCNIHGEPLPQGIYIWRAEAVFLDDQVWTGENNESGVPEHTQGTVLLLRE